MCKERGEWSNVVSSWNQLQTLVSPSDNFACSIVVPVAIPHEGLTSRGTVYSNCSS